MKKSRDNQIFQFCKLELVISTIIALLVYAGIKYSIFMYFAFFLLLVSILSSKGNKYILYVLFVFPFSAIFKISIFGSISILNIIIIVVLLKQLFSYLNGKISIDKAELFLWVIVSIYISLSSFGMIIDAMQTVGYFIFILLFLNSNNKVKFSVSASSMILFFIFGLVLSSIMAITKGIYPELSSLLVYEITYFGDNDVVRFSGLFLSSNYYSMVITMAVAFLLVLYDTKVLNKTFFIVLPLLIYFGFLTGSKSFLVSVLVIFFVYLFWVFFSNIRKGFKTITILLIILLLFLSFADLTSINDVLQRYLYDFQNSFDLSDFTSGRISISLVYLKYIFSDLTVFLFGTGFNSGPLNDVASHNYILEVFYHLGFMGSLIYFLLVIRLITKNMEKKNFNLLLIIPLAVFILRSFAINLFFRDSLYFYIILISSVFYLPRNVEVQSRIH
ncbi:MAG: hypothetical protein JEZ05_00845 [Tenericutes bacterium]|nr:hypothetical protein [Mycoplasmatota bacterium]